MSREKYLVKKKLFDSSSQLHSGLLPIHLKPKADELFSSWLIRLAHSHTLSIESFCTSLFGREANIWNRDIDKNAPDWIIEILVKATGTEEKKIRRTLLKSYENCIFEHLNTNGSNKWIIPLGIYHRKRKKLGLVVCTECLKEDIEPYYRKKWRLSFLTTCTKHSIYLIDCCPQCLKPIIPHRVDMNKHLFPSKDIFTLCWYCEFDLRKHENNKIAGKSLVSQQLFYEKIMKSGYVAWDNNPNMYSLVFFEGLYSLIVGLQAKESLFRLQDITLLRNTKLFPLKNHSFENMTLEQRKVILWLCSWINRDWPKRFIYLIKKYELRYSDLKGWTRNRVYWYEKIIKSECLGSHLPVTDTELISIVAYVESIKGFFDLQFARRFSGYDISRKFKKHLTMKVNFDIYENLLVSIEQEIASTLNEKKRLCLLRDKFMFSCAYILGLHLRELSLLNSSDIKLASFENVEVNFFDLPRNKTDIMQWLYWYVKNIRVKFKGESQHEYLFISFDTGDRLSTSTIGMRFQRAVSVANIKIKNYRCWV